MHGPTRALSPRVLALGLVGASLLGCPSDPMPGPTDAGLDAGGSADDTPRWAFEPWISKDISTGATTRARSSRASSERDIPVGVVVLDSPWETNYNTFVPNPSATRTSKASSHDLRADDIRARCSGSRR
jgi:hypothetical protein